MQVQPQRFLPLTQTQREGYAVGAWQITKSAAGHQNYRAERRHREARRVARHQKLIRKLVADEAPS